MLSFLGHSRGAPIASPKHNFVDFILTITGKTKDVPHLVLVEKGSDLGEGGLLLG